MQAQSFSVHFEFDLQRLDLLTLRVVPFRLRVKLRQHRHRKIVPIPRAFHRRRNHQATFQTLDFIIDQFFVFGVRRRLRARAGAGSSGGRRTCAAFFRRTKLFLKQSQI